MVCAVVRSLTARESVPVSTPLMDIGIDSLSAANFVSELSQRTALQLSPTLIFEHSTAEAVAQHVALLLSGSSDTRPILTAQAACVRVAQLDVVEVVGRWPDGVPSQKALRCLTAGGCDAVGEVPGSRWTTKVAASLDKHTRTAQFLATIPHADLFDGSLNAIAPAEAAAMDPQQRLLLETGTEALSLTRASLAAETKSTDDVGVFLGITNTDFSHVLASSTSVFAATGAAISIASGRLSFALGLQGPCESIDTACSSAVVALHGAALAVCAGDCPIALTTAVTLILVPHVSISYARAGMLSVDGRCKTFDKSANGYVRGEGVGGHVITSQVLGKASPCVGGSAVRQDGKSASLTAPNGSAQSRLIAVAISRAATSSSDGHNSVNRIESHGTGTPLGDPTEARALAQARAPAPTKCVLGGVKANVGHLEPAAGMVGFCVAVNMLLHQEALPNAHLRQLNPHLQVPISGSLQLPATVSAPNSMLDTASDAIGLSSFGYSGTISHVILHPKAPKLSAEGEYDPTPPHQACHRRLAFPWLPYGSAKANVTSSTGVTTPAAFLGLPFAGASDVEAYEGPLSAHEANFLKGHRVGQVPLIPGTCYIEFARAFVTHSRGSPSPFELLDVQLMAIIFLDDELDAPPTIRTSLEASGQLTFSSRRNVAWSMTGTMRLQVGAPIQERLDLATVKEQRAREDHFTREQFYEQTGNKYRDEFIEGLQQGWGNAKAALSHVVYQRAERTHVHLRSSAWLDALLHAPVWWSQHQGRPWYIAGAASYHVHSSDLTTNRQFWGVMSSVDGMDVAPPSRMDDLRYYGAKLECRVSIGGTQLNFFEVASLERRRVRQHVYQTVWRPSSDRSMSRIAPALGVWSNHAAIVTSHDLPRVSISSSEAKRFGDQWSVIILALAVQVAEDAIVPLRVLERTLSAVQAEAVERSSSTPLWIVTRRIRSDGLPQHAGLWGLARAARAELPSLSLSTLDLLSPDPHAWLALFSRPPTSAEVACGANGSFVVPRLARFFPAVNGTLRLSGAHVPSTEIPTRRLRHVRHSVTVPLF